MMFRGAWGEEIYHNFTFSIQLQFFFQLFLPIFKISDVFYHAVCQLIKPDSGCFDSNRTLSELEIFIHQATGNLKRTRLKRLNFSRRTIFGGYLKKMDGSFRKKLD